MKQVYFVRHAKSSWENLMLSDQERPLNARGKRDAPVMAQKLKEENAQFDLLLTSPATRAQQTAAIFEEILEIGSTQTINKIYHAAPDTLTDIIMELDTGVQKAIVFGHNPGLTYLYNDFSTKMLDNLPTCGVFRLQFDGDAWSDMDRTNTRANFLIYPKLYH